MFYIDPKWKGTKIEAEGEEHLSGVKKSDKPNIPTFAERTNLVGTDASISKHYRPSTLAEYDYGLDLNTLKDKYSAESVEAFYKGRQEVADYMLRHPDVVLNRLQHEYGHDKSSFLPLDLFYKMKHEEKMLRSMSKSSPTKSSAMKALSQGASYQDIVESSKKTIQETKEANKPNASWQDVAMIPLEVFASMGSEALGRAGQGINFVSNLLRGESTKESLESSRKLYENLPKFNPESIAPRTKLGDLLREPLNIAMGWVDPAIRGAAKVINKGVELSARHEGGPEFKNVSITDETTENVIGDLLSGWMAFAGLKPIAKFAFNRKPKILKESLVDNSHLTSNIEALSRSTNLAEATAAMPNTLKQWSKAEIEAPVKVPEGVGKVKSNVTNFFDSFSNTANRQNLQELWGMKEGYKNIAGAHAKSLSKELNALTKEQKEFMFRAINENNPTLVAAKDRPLFERVQADFTSGTDELIRRGILDKETGEALRGQYALRQFAGKEDVASMHKQRKGLSLEEQRQAGLVEDIALSYDMWSDQYINTIANDVFLKGIVDNPNWVSPGSFTRFKDINGVMRTVNTKEMPAKIRELQDHINSLSDTPQAKENIQKLSSQIAEEKIKLDKYSQINTTESNFAKGVSEQKMQSLQEQLKQAEGMTPAKEVATQRLQILKDAYDKIQESKHPANMVAVPDQPQYGKLRGSYVDKGIYHQYIEPMVMDISPKGGAVETFKNANKAMTSWFKVSKTVLNIPSWIRNFGEGFVRLGMSGVPIKEIPGVYWRGLKSMMADDALCKEAKARGLFSGIAFGDAELKPAGDVLAAWTKSNTQNLTHLNNLGILEASKNLPLKLKGWLSDKVSNIVDFSSKMYQLPDQIATHAKFIEQRTRGVSGTYAASEARFWGMDYSTVDPLIRSARQYFLPFVTYQYKIIPLLLKSIKQHPGFWIGSSLMMSGLEQFLQMASGDVNVQGAKSIISMYPEAIAKQMTSFLLPGKTPDGGYNLMSIDGSLPQSAVSQSIQSALQGNIKDAVLKLLPFGNGALSSIMSLLNSQDGVLRDASTGRPITNPFSSVSSQIIDFAKYAFQQVALPPFLTSNGAFGKFLSVEYGDDMAYKNDWSWTNVVGAMMGVTTIPISAAKQKRRIDFHKRILDSSYSYYKQNVASRDSQETFNLVTKDYQQKRFMLDHYEVNKPMDVSSEEYMRLTNFVPAGSHGKHVMMMDRINLPLDTSMGLYKEAMGKGHESSNYDKLLLYNQPIVRTQGGQ